MTAVDVLREHIPDSCRDLLELTDNELKSEIPALARDQGRMGEVEQAVRSLPSHHDLYQGDSRDLSMIDDESVQLIATSPPYFNLKDYENGVADGQLGDINDYERFNQMLDGIWEQCYEKLVPGGRLCVVVGDVLRSRSEHGRHRVIPLHASIQEHCTAIGYDNLAPVIWYKIGNASLESGGNARFLGKPYEPGAVIKNDIEYILLFRKPGGYRSPSIEERILSTIEADEHQKMFRQLWDDITGKRQGEHPAPYPAALAERLIRMFSFAGDTVLDPFAGTGSTAVAASRVGRNSVSVEIEPKYIEIAEERIQGERGTLTNYQNLTVDVTR
ncbi:DNA-methyltransferase [Halococcus hamelinensis]|uniref:Type II methyltransferase n=1 Tax=Halococcus hamelinensis 100A6 TaxID=1132509 RepID=M0M883_9EURY|nr:site-specific DNA-methyltransferase [Halococcus hamelinensis]EMA41946.1 DNA methylase N-4/N-6 domain-containing protein [Halococcus hamelinensis 100A6]